MENTIISQENNGPKALSDVLNADKEHNTQMLLQVPGLKDTIVPIIGNQFFFPKQFNVDEEKLSELIKTTTTDELGYIHTEVTIDDKPVMFHQHITALTEKDKTYYPQNALNFNIEGIKIIFENKIPLCFKQTVALLAYQTRNPHILALGFEKEELVEVTCALQHTLNLTHEVTDNK